MHQERRPAQRLKGGGSHRERGRFSALTLLVLAGLTVISVPVGAQDEAETVLVPRYLETIGQEITPETATIMTAINRWHSDLYPDDPLAATAYHRACLIDPVTFKLARTWEEVSAGASTTAEKVIQIDTWNSRNLCHTQAQTMFQNFPGSDPWGFATDGGPTYRKLLPSEMEAMRGLTGRISGKCMTLANLLTAAFIHLGVDPRDIVMVISRQDQMRHGAALLVWDGVPIMTNNHRMAPLYMGLAPDTNPVPLTVEALYNQAFFAGIDFVIPAEGLGRELFASDGYLMPAFVQRYSQEEAVPEAFTDPSALLADPARFREQIFAEPGDLDGAWLTRYAYQSLYVARPERYVQASMLESHTRDLAGQIHEPDEIITWIRENISYGSIFADAADRIMTTDQVLVFDRGGWKDQGVLACALMALNGYEPELLICPETALVAWDGRVVDLATGNEAERPVNPLLTISAVGLAQEQGDGVLDLVRSR